MKASVDWKNGGYTHSLKGGRLFLLSRVAFLAFCMILVFLLQASVVSSSDLCQFCGMENPCPMGCEGISVAASGEKRMIMTGIPPWLFYTGLTVIFLVSFLYVKILNRKGNRRKEYPRFDILSIPFLSSWMKQPSFKFLFQFPFFLIFCFIIYAGIFGHGIINIAPILTWTIWWAGLIFLVLFFGKAWCFICPWDFVATLFQRLKPYGVTPRPFTLGLKWPHWLRNIYLAIGLFIVLTWFELGFNITSSPRYTAIFAIMLVVLSVIPALIFEKRSYCKYGCLVGRISGLYSMFAPIEVRSSDPSVCDACKTKDCYTGNSKGSACPTSLMVPQIEENTYCILCTECVRSCPKDNVAINFRPFATDLLRFKKVKRDEGLLAILLLALTFFHGLTMTELWDSSTNPSIIGLFQSELGLGYLSSFSVAMLIVNGGIVFLYWVLSVFTHSFAGDPEVSRQNIFLSYAYSLLPIALSYHLVHNGMHFFMEGQILIPLLSDPLGRGNNFFGTAAWTMAPLLSNQSIWVFQVVLLVIGHIFGIVIAHSVSRKLYPDRKKAIRSLIPMLAGMIIFSFLSLWIIHLDMNMRSTLM